MELVKALSIPVIADFVLSPEVYYGDDITAICFTTQDDSFGRITFNNLDAIKVCRGEMMPYQYNYGSDEWKFELYADSFLTFLKEIAGRW